MTRAGVVLLIAVVFIAVAAPWLAPNTPDSQFSTYLYAPPTTLHFDEGHGTYFYPLQVVSRRCTLCDWEAQVIERGLGVDPLCPRCYGRTERAASRIAGLRSRGRSRSRRCGCCRGR